MSNESTQSAFEKKLQEQTATTAFQLVWGWVEKLGKKGWEKIQVQRAMKVYAEIYRERHGAIHVLGMSKPIPLHEIYTSVRVVSRDFLGAFVNPDQMEKAFKESGRQHSSFGKDKVEDGIEVANQEQFLNLLGAPGAGKSTFLRRLGQEAMFARKPSDRIDPKETGLDSRYEHPLLPVYLELRDLRSKSIDLLARITDEFATCGFPESQAFVEAAIENGKLLVLLDGLDEVPNEKLDDVIDHIRGFVDQHAKAGNRFVTSCRTAHYKQAFPRFTDMVIADFDDEQIEKFAGNWFNGLQHKQAETAKKFVALLKEPTNTAALELARTPLLLTFLCITYNYGELPPTRATLYRRALDLLLREWAASKRVHDEPVYRELNADLELDMLAELAEELFREDRFFFNRERVTSHIRKFMSQQLNAPKNLDAGKILEAIEVQQGLIVRRAQDTYSFSHLTIQEYLTSKSIWEEGELSWKQLVNDHLFDERWSVVFELMAGMGKADNLINVMANNCRLQLGKWCSSDPIGWVILKWISDSTKRDSANMPGFAAASRLILFAIAFDLALDSSTGRTVIQTGRETKFNLTTAYPFSNTTLLVDDSRKEFALPYPDTTGSHLVTYDYTPQFEYSLRYLSVDHAIAFARKPSDYALVLARTLDGAIADALTQYNESDPKDLGHGNVHKLVRICLNLQLVDATKGGFLGVSARLAQPGVNLEDILRDFGLPTDTSGIQRMFSDCSYFMGMVLVVRCMRAAYRLSSETWDDVCNSVLRRLPASS